MTQAWYRDFCTDGPFPLTLNDAALVYSMSFFALMKSSRGEVGEVKAAT
jgi:hypothetical protein